MNTIQRIEQKTAPKKDYDFNVGDTVKIMVRVVEGAKQREQAFQGVVIKQKGGGATETFTVRKISSGIGVERVFPLHSPNLMSIKVVRRGKVRRAKLYYLRDRIGKFGQNQRKALAHECARPSAEEVRAARYEALEAFDRGYAEQGHPRVAGVDEVGRGALAGPVVCAALILPRDSGLVGVDDSKALDPDHREALFDRIVGVALAVAIAFGHPDVIDRDNILNATLATMHRAVDALRIRPDLVLVDGRDTFQWRGIMVPVVQGDSLSLAIAGASIVAKLARDRMMRRLHGRYPEYDFQQNKGYGTKDHVAAITRYGAAEVHRRSFL